ncbi:hypothetical protein B0J13DRAFT_573564 [Dactylonectria estremocensis]|uniref:Rhodopsin domain-containing protein n=1 Tax=Dactylonectria estremocensis TaxID=1079267 RepID=A0A9P9D8J4_9HYPO|nr:hypothetical protein B0J13DRAFT_573564 [Dactylonectria estremocensis]
MSAFIAEIWTWYALTWVIVVARMYVGHSSLPTFEMLSGVATDATMSNLPQITNTVFMIGMSVISRTSSNLIDPNDDTELTPENIKERIVGSKWVLVVEQMQILTIWTVKICLLLMYNRLTMSLNQNLAVKIVAGYVVVGFVVMEILYLGVWCRPFDQYWAVPPENTQCSAATNHLITNAVLNISSDIMIILIPMPIFLQSQLPVKRKAVFCGVFGLGAFTIMSAILNKFYSFNEPFGSNWTFWYVRESSTAMITANLPYIWTLLRRLFNLKSFAGSSHKRPANPSTRFQSNFSHGHRSAVRAPPQGTLHRLDSEERINNTYSMPKPTPRERRSPPGCIPSVLSASVLVKDRSLPSGSRDEETGSERSAVGVIKLYHRV